MAVGGAATTFPFPGIWKLYASHWKRVNLLPFLLISLLCSASYFLGVYHNARGSITTTAATTSSVSCSSTAAVRVSAGNGSSAPANTTLDFDAHHGAGEESEGEAAPAAREYPPCDVKYSEYTPCEDVQRSLKFPRDRLVYRERHCPEKEELLKCLVPAPHGYRTPFPWPTSRGAAWFANVPHKELTVEKAVQNWIRVDGDKFRFPGGGTMFPNGADAYIDDIERLVPLRDGSIRTAVDTGCGVASWGAYLLSRNVLTMSIAPRDSHEAQVQFALERGVPAMIGVLASSRLPYPARAFDMAHCSRCLIPWHLYDGLFLLEVDRILRPGGYWILSGPPINWQKHWKGWKRTQEDLGAEQDAIEAAARSICWKKIKQVGDIAVWQKPTNHIHCRASRRLIQSPQFCPLKILHWYQSTVDLGRPTFSSSLAHDRSRRSRSSPRSRSPTLSLSTAATAAASARPNRTRSGQDLPDLDLPRSATPRSAAHAPPATTRLGSAPPHADSTPASCTPRPACASAIRRPAQICTDPARCVGSSL